MELNLELKLRNVYGGDGIVRPYEVEEIKMSRSRTKERTRQDLGVPVESTMKEVETELKQTVCNTFARDGDGTPMLRLGGSHGKLWGALKQSAVILNDARPKELFPSFSAIKRMMDAVTVTPIDIRLEDAGEMSVKTLPVMMKTMGGGSQVPHYFDVIPECRAKVKIVYPDAMEKQMRAILKQVQEISCLNKRRATIEILKAD